MLDIIIIIKRTKFSEAYDTSILVVTTIISVADVSRGTVSQSEIIQCALNVTEPDSTSSRTKLSSCPQSRRTWLYKEVLRHNHVHIPYHKWCEVVPKH